MALQELDILKRLEPSIKNDSDRWPEFVLEDCEVTSQDTGQPTSLLLARTGAKLRLQGVLSDDNRPRAKVVATQKRRIIVSDIETYSFAKYDDGTLGFWAAGKAGWFELRAVAKSYKDVYCQMEEATAMFYYLADKFSNSRKSTAVMGKKDTYRYVRKIFADFYNSDMCRGRRDPDDCKEGFYQQRYFLIKSMLEGQEGLPWEGSAYLRYFNLACPADYAAVDRIVAVIQGRGPVEEPKVSAAGSSRVSSSSAAPEASPSRRRSGSGALNTSRMKKERRRSNRQVPQATTQATIVDMEIDGDEEQDDNVSSDEISQLRGPARGEHKRKSMLRLKGDKGPKKSSYRREGLRSFRRVSDAGKDGPDAMDENTSEEDQMFKEPHIGNGTVAKLMHMDLDALEPADEYMEARGPQNTWTCPYDGCNHQVWDSRSDAGADLIKQHHTNTHQDSIEELIRSEAKPWAHVSHLLDKIKAMRSDQPAPPMRDDRLDPIKRRF